MNPLATLLLIIVIAVGLLVLVTNKLQLHPFFALLIVALFVGFATGIESSKIINLITSGFGNILAGIGIIVVLGTVMGVYVEKSGALDVIADYLLKSLGSRRLISAVSFLGAMVSIPVFCDSGFVIMSRLVRKVARLKGSNSVPLSLSLGAGLYTTHTLVPPTPGPIAVAGNLNIGDQIGVIILAGLLVSIPVLLIGSFFAQKLGSGIHIEDEIELPEDSESEHKMSLLWALTPIISPIVLISIRSILTLSEINGWFLEPLLFIGNPVIALIIGCGLAMVQVGNQKSLKEIGELFKNGVTLAGPIILITGAGGAFGSVLKGTDLAPLLTEFFGESLSSFPVILMLSFLIASLLKIAQGSSTSALIISSAIIAPIVGNSTVVDPFHLALLVLAFGGGAMTFSHANDSYFWVVTQFSGMTMKQGYKGFTLLTLVLGLTTLLSVFLFYYLTLVF